MGDQETTKVTDRSKEGEQKQTTATKSSTENFTAEQQAQPTEKFTTYSGEEPKKVLLAAKSKETLEEFTARTKQYHEDQERKAKEKPVQPLSIGGFEDGSEVTAGGRKKTTDSIEPQSLSHEIAHAPHPKVFVDPRPSYVEGLKAIGNDEDAQGLYSIEYIERKAKAALASAQKTTDADRDRVIVADNDPEHSQMLLAQLNEKAAAVDKPKLQGYISEPENPWQAFKNLTPEQRKEVIRILNNASQDTIDSMNKQGTDVLNGKPVIDFVLSIDRAVRALGTGAWKENISNICRDLQKIATGQPVGQQETMEKTATLGAGTLIKGIQGVDQAGQHAHPRAFVHDTHATAEAMRQGISTAGQYFGEKIKNNDLGSIPGETADAANYAKEQTAKAIKEFPDKDVTEQSNVLGAAATIVFLVAATRELVTPENARKMGLLNLTEEELEAQGIQKKHIKEVPPEDIVNPIDRGASLEEKIRQLQKLSSENEPLTKQYLKELDEKFGTESGLSHKDPQDIALKANRPTIRDTKDWFEIEHLRDTFRFKTVLNDLKDLPKVAEELKKSQFEIIKVDTDKMLNPKQLGWRMVALDLRAPNGQLVEYQFLVPEMDEVGKTLHHPIYKKWRSEPVASLTPEQNLEMTKDQFRAKKAADKAWQRYLTRTGQSEKDVDTVLKTVKQSFEGD